MVNKFEIKHHESEKKKNLFIMCALVSEILLYVSIIIISPLYWALLNYPSEKMICNYIENINRMRRAGMVSSCLFIH